MPAENVADLAEQRAFRDRVGAGARIREGSACLADIVAAGPYHSDDPVHRAAVDCEILRTEVRAIADHRPSLRIAAAALDAAADELNEYAETLGL